MGSPPDEIGRETDELQHRVVISEGFYMSTTEVTQGQWKKLMGENPSAFQELGDKGPVNQVSWRDCQAFISRLNALEKTDRYRLPTEAQWEYACRAGSQTAFAGGGIHEASCKYMEALAKMAWYCGDSGFKPHPVSLLAPNAWGLYDMHGNVAEWCLDACRWRDIWTRRVNVITDTYRDGITDPVSVTGESRVFRGGSWNQSSQYQRSADRACFNPGLRRSDIGFRVVKLK
jgi:formylglycine-generating enzyme required for sulfatase activity